MISDNFPFFFLYIFASCWCCWYLMPVRKPNLAYYQIIFFLLFIFISNQLFDKALLCFFLLVLRGKMFLVPLVKIQFSSNERLGIWQIYSNDVIILCSKFKYFKIPELYADFSGASHSFNRMFKYSISIKLYVFPSSFQIVCVYVCFSINFQFICDCN